MDCLPTVMTSDNTADAAVTGVRANEINPAFNGELIILKKLNELLKGIAPAPRQFSCAEILENLDRHRNLLELPHITFPVHQETPKVNFLNGSEASEEIALLSMKLQTKFVPSETSSSYSIWTETARQLAKNANMRRQFNGISPGRRLSHLAKRRQMFSKANLQQLAQNEPKNHRLAIRTNVNQRNVAKEYLEYKESRPRLNIPKRALFQSPDEPPVRPGFQTVAKQVPRRRLFGDINRNAPVAELPHGGGCYDVSSWLASQPFGNRKRAREDSTEKNPKRRCPRRSLDFSDASPSQNSQVSSHSSSKSAAPLSNVHKKKLLWAVATALKEMKITSQHAQFKVFAKKLFEQCRKNLTAILALQCRSGTSEKMLSYAREHAIIIVGNSEPPVSVLSDLSNTLFSQTQPEILATCDGKENICRTPKRLAKPRTWRSCIKSLKKRNPLGLNRSLSCEDLKDSIKIGCKRKRELLETPTENAHGNCQEIENTPAKANESENLKSAVVAESPEIEENDFCLPASQEESEPCLFPALVRQLSPPPRSPDLFDCDDAGDQIIDSEQAILTTGEEKIPPADESALPADISKILLDLNCVQNEDNSVIDQDIFEDVTGYDEDHNELLDLSCVTKIPRTGEISNSADENNKDNVMNVLNNMNKDEPLDLSRPDGEPTIKDIPSAVTANDDEANQVLNLSCIRKDLLDISAINHESVEDAIADVEDNDDTNANESLSDSEGHICTSTPMVSVPKRILRRNKPAWKVEKGPGLKIRVRLSKEWDVVGRKSPQASRDSKESTATPEIDLKPTVVETQIKNPLFMRLNSVDTSGSSTDNYNLMELRDKLDIERTLGADPSEMSFFESSPNSVSHSDSSNGKMTIVEVAPEVTINCYRRKRFSVFESDSSSDDDKPLGNYGKKDCESEDEQPLSQLIKPKSDVIEQSIGKDEKSPERLLVESKSQDDICEDDLPLSQLAGSNTEEVKNETAVKQVAPAVVKKITLDSYKARRSSINQASSESSTPPKKIYNIRLKKNNTNRDSSDKKTVPAFDLEATIEKSERIIHQTFSEFAWLIHQKMQSTITDSTDFETKIEKLNKLNEMSLVQQRVFAFFQQKTLEIREKLEYPS